MSLASERRYSAACAIKNATSRVTCPSVIEVPSSAGCEHTWAEPTHDRALERLELLGGELARSHPGAAASLRRGIEETLTIQRLGITGSLKATLVSTNPIESMTWVRAAHRP